MNEEELKDLTNKIKSRIIKMDMTKPQIEKEIRELYDELVKFYSKLNKHDYNTVKEYCDSEQDVAKAGILSLIEKRKDVHLLSVKNILEEYDRSKTDEENFEDLEDDNKVQKDTMVLLEDSLMDVIPGISRIMDSRGYPQNLIENIGHEARRRIKDRLKKFGMKVGNIFKEDRKAVMKIINDEYEEVIGQINRIAIDSEDVKQFTESLNVHIGYKEQNEYAKQATGKQVKKAEQVMHNPLLPEDVF